jgi:hypothetical protein
MGLKNLFKRVKLTPVGDTLNGNFQLMTGTAQRSITVMSDQDPGLRSRLRRFELGRIVLEVLAEALPDELFRWTKDGEFVDLSSDEPADPAAREAEHEKFWTTHEGLASEVEFHNRLNYVVGELTRAYQQLDLAVLQNRVQRLLWLEQVLDTESMVAVYETAYVLGCLPVAHLCSDYFMFEPGYMIVQSCMDVLHAKRDRRAGTGAPPRPDSEAWYRVHEILAVLKWKGPEADRDRLLTVEELVESYLGVERRCLDFIASHPVPDHERHQKVKNDLGWCLLQVIKAAMRFQPQQARELIAHFNAIHGPVLEAQPGHFLRFASTQRVDPWYWDFELFKACTSGPVSDDEANLCYQWRLDAMRRQERQDDVLRSFRLGAKNELEIWISQVRQDALPVEVRRAS